MANKTQAKAAVDNGATQIKSDIDNTLPVGVDITSGSVIFGPGSNIAWFYSLNATTQAAADTLATNIKTNLTNAARTFTETRNGRRSTDDGGKSIVIVSTLASYTIKGY